VLFPDMNSVATNLVNMCRGMLTGATDVNSVATNLVPNGTPDRAKDLKKGVVQGWGRVKCGSGLEGPTVEPTNCRQMSKSSGECLLVRPRMVFAGGCVPAGTTC
jgi:hypothetical protein